MLPYSFHNNDFKFHLINGFSAPGGFEEHLKNEFDVLYEEGCEGTPKMMSIGLHCRVVGRQAQNKQIIVLNVLHECYR